MLDVVHCKVLSVIESEHLDAYLLSESSMFVFNHKLILKTCGTTTLLWGLPHILEIAASKAGFPHHKFSSLKGMPNAATPYRVFYSRKNFLFPDRQRGPHRSWKDEVRYLDNMFSGGSAYMVGKMNGDHWYLYLTSPNTILTPPATPDREKSTETKILQFPAEGHISFCKGKLGNDDETLEILMTDLEPENAKQFYLENASAVAEGKYFQMTHEARQKANFGHFDVAVTDIHEESCDISRDSPSNIGSLTPDRELCYPAELSTEGHALGTVVSEACGLSDVYPTSCYPDARVDAYLFTPCGFSANGVIPAPDQLGSATHYFTVHVTPEPQCSYASFETNVPGRRSGRETADVIQHVVDIFKPGCFSVTLFEAKASAAEISELDGPWETMVDVELEGRGRERSLKMDAIKGYRRVERIVHEFDGYDLVFRYYEQNEWTGGAPRVGEVS
jgi:S-adenosylmethionine decarboxylase